jgi:hypothetical protein
MSLGKHEVAGCIVESECVGDRIIAKVSKSGVILAEFSLINGVLNIGRLYAPCDFKVLTQCAKSICGAGTVCV